MNRALKDSHDQGGRDLHDNSELCAIDHTEAKTVDSLSDGCQQKDYDYCAIDLDPGANNKMFLVVICVVVSQCIQLFLL